MNKSVFSPVVNCLTCMQIPGKNKAVKFSGENRMTPLQRKETADIIINGFLNFRIGRKRCFVSKYIYLQASVT